MSTGQQQVSSSKTKHSRRKHKNKSISSSKPYKTKANNIKLKTDKNSKIITNIHTRIENGKSALREFQNNQNNGELLLRFVYYSYKH